MLKRILVIACGCACGLIIAAAVTRLFPALSPWADSSVERNVAEFRRVLATVEANYVDAKDADGDALTRAAFDGMVKSLDPHSEYMRADAYRELREEMDGRFGGIGIQIEQREGRIVVIAPIADTPSERAGVQRGDQIAKVDGQSVEKLGMDKIIRRLRGKPGSNVSVTFYRPSNKRILEYALVRETINVESVRDARLLPGGIGFVQLVQFSERTGEEFRKALQRLCSEGAKALVIDLRNNPGGLLDAAVAVAEPFFRRGDLIVYTQGRRPDSRQDLCAGNGAGNLRLPLAILVNSGTASAAEIVAGALKDTGRAVIVGEKTFGKGSVQSVFRLPNNEALRLTTARYYTPSGISIHEKGIEPTIPVAVSVDEVNNVRLQRLRHDLVASKEFAARFGMDPVADRPLDTAVDILRGVILVRERNAKAGGGSAR